MNATRVLLPLIVVLGACASTPPPFAGTPDTSAPVQVVAREPAAFVDQRVLWGGMVLEVRNFESHSELEVLAFPLDTRQRPRPEQRDHGRFIALVPGFIDPAELPSGRFVSVLGRVTGDREGLLHNDAYVWPEVDARDLYVWPKDFRESATRWRFSVGVGVRF